MKVAKSKTPVRIDGSVQTKQFGIVFDRHMVNILSNQLYEDKILAIVRELSTNANDSQIEAGFNGQFEVHLPNWNDMNFWIRDYGTGMSPEKVDNIYRNYGASDRNDSNDFTGCMGLGSKTPFCYHTKTFTVDSWYQGVHYQYACFLNEDGMPEIALMSQEPSSLATGVQVTLPVKQGDQYDFEIAAEKVYRFFKMVPNISGRNINIVKPEYTLEDGKWKYDENEKYGMQIVMGNVAYRVNERSLGDLTVVQRKVVKAGFHVYVDIGEIGITASREGLDYTNRTKTHVRAYINEVISSFNNKAQNDIAQCKNLWDARLRFAEYERDSLRGIFDASKIQYDGNVLFNEDDCVDFNNMVKEDKIEVYCYTHNRYQNPERRKIRSIRLRQLNKLRLYDNDLKIGGFVRSIAECKQHESDIILVKFNNEYPNITQNEIKQEFYDTLGLDASYLTLISTIPSPTVRNSGNRTRTKTTKAMRFRSRLKKSTIMSSYWENVPVDMDDGGIYIEFSRFSAKFNNTCVGPSHLASLIATLEECDIVVPDIIGVKSAHIKPFNKHSKWSEFYEWAVMQLRTKIAGRDLSSPIEYASALNNLGRYIYRSGNRLSIDNIYKIAKYCNENTQFAKFSQTIKCVEELAKDCDKVKKLNTACMLFNIEVKEHAIQDFNLDTLENNIYKKYKLLLQCDSYAWNEVENCRHTGFYINSVENL